jgi:chromosome segregation ATPase
LREELETIGQRISLTEGKIAELERDKSRMTRSLALIEPAMFREEQLDECIQSIERARTRLKAYEEERTKNQQALTELCPTPARVKARQALQEEFTQAGDKRIKKTRQVQGLLQQLRQALQERIDLGCKMRSAAEGLECDISGDALDEMRFEDCLASLPDDLLSASETWHGHFGTPNRRKA